MKNISKNYTLYKFEELSQEAQERAIADYFENSQESIDECIASEMEDFFHEYLEEKGYRFAVTQYFNFTEVRHEEKGWDEHKVFGFVSNQELQNVVSKIMEAGNPKGYLVDEMAELLRYEILTVTVDSFCGKTEAESWWMSVAYALENSDYEKGSLENAVWQLEEIVKSDFEAISERLRGTYFETVESYSSEEFAISQLDYEDESFNEDGEFILA